MTHPIIPDWNQDFPEEILSNSYAHIDRPKEFFDYLEGLIGNNYSGNFLYDPEKATATCTIRKMERQLINGSSTGQEYQFQISLFKSKQYVSIKKENNYDDDDDFADSQVRTNKTNVYVVTTKRLQVKNDIFLQSLEFIGNIETSYYCNIIKGR